MPVPDYQSIMLPLLHLAGDGKEHRFRDAVEALANELQLTSAERAELLPSGTAPLFDNRVGWARTYLKQAGLLESPKRGVFRITDSGRSLLAENPPRIGVELLTRYESFKQFLARDNSGPTTTPPQIQPEALQPSATRTPEDELAAAYERIRNTLETELLDQVRESSPGFFERLVVDLLVAMGYGGSRQDAGRAVGKSGDEGIDGIIKEDKLGLETIYIQAKRWEGVVGRPEIQKFAGALQGHRATKGVFITTSSYTREATEFASKINIAIILIDGRELAQLMIDHDVGVSTIGRYELKKIDTDYFEGD